MKSQTIARINRINVILSIILFALVSSASMPSNLSLNSQKNAELLSNEMSTKYYTVEIETMNQKLTAESNTSIDEGQSEKPVSTSEIETENVETTKANTSDAAKETKTDTVVKTEKKTQETSTNSNIELKYSESYNVTSNPLTPSMGVKYYNGHRETWYSQKVLPGPGLKIPGRHVADDGTIRDGEGYIVLASDLSYKSRGSVVQTSLGPGKVYDTGCAYGTIDIYVNW